MSGAAASGAAWIDLEIAKHILSSGVAPIYIVEIPGFADSISEQDVAGQVAQLCQVPGSAEAFAADAGPVIRQLRRRQYNAVQPFYSDGIEALCLEDLRLILEKLAHDLDARAELVRLGAASHTTVPPYNKRFSGRLDELMALREQLKDDRAGVISGVHGLGGIGKTELAFTYAHAFAAAYPGGRFLVPCEGKSRLSEALLHLDEIFRNQISDEERKTPDRHFEAIRGCLSQRLDAMGHILLVLDNVSDAGMLAAEQTDALTALGPKLHLLATTRLLPGPSGQIRWTTLGELPEHDALELLEKHRSFADDAERDAGRKIVKRLGGFALAVELVAAWLAAHPGVSCAGFLERLGLEELETLDSVAEDRDVELRRHNHERRLAAVVEPTIRALGKENLAALRALVYSAFLPPDQVPLPWLKALVAVDFPEIGTLPRPGYEDSWNDVCRALWKYGLVSRSERTGEDADAVSDSRIVRVHRLVQGLVRGKLAPAINAARQKAVDQLIDARDDELTSVIRWQEFRWELEPFEAMALLRAENGHLGAAWLLNQSGLRWSDIAEWSRAEPLYRRALTINEKSFGPDHHKVGINLNNLAQLLQATNRLSEAEPLMRRALAISEKSFGPDHLGVVTEVNNLAGLLAHTNRRVEAEQLFRRELAIYDRSSLPDDPGFAIGLSNLASLLKETNRLMEAEPLYRRALSIDEASFGPDHPSVARDLGNLGLLLDSTNRSCEAEPLFLRALAIKKASFGPEHPSVAVSLINLAQLFHSTNRLAESEQLYRQALSIDESSFGPNHPNVARDLNNLAKLLQDTNRLKEAESLYRRALSIDEVSFGPEHPKVATVSNNLALLMQETNQLQEAERLFRRALMINEKSFGTDHPDVATILNNLALILQHTNRLPDAEALFRRALVINEKSFGTEHSSVAINLNNLANLFQDTNRLAEAEPLVRRALSIDEASFGPDHPAIARDRCILAKLLQVTNQLAEAEPLFRRALVVYEKSFGPNHTDIAITLHCLANLLRLINRLAEAEPLASRALQILLRFEAETGHPHPRFGRVIENYRQLLAAMCRSEDEIRVQLNEIGQPFGVNLGEEGPKTVS